MRSCLFLLGIWYFQLLYFYVTGVKIPSDFHLEIKGSILLVLFFALDVSELVIKLIRRK